MNMVLLFSILSVVCTCSAYKCTTKKIGMGFMNYVSHPQMPPMVIPHKKCAMVFMPGIMCQLHDAKPCGIEVEACAMREGPYVNLDEEWKLYVQRGPPCAGPVRVMATISCCGHGDSLERSPEYVDYEVPLDDPTLLRLAQQPGSPVRPEDIAQEKSARRSKDAREGAWAPQRRRSARDDSPVQRRAAAWPPPSSPPRSRTFARRRKALRPISRRNVPNRARGR